MDTGSSDYRNKSIISHSCLIINNKNPDSKNTFEHQLKKINKVYYGYIYLHSIWR